MASDGIREKRKSQAFGLPAVWVKADNPSGWYSSAAGFVDYLSLAVVEFRQPDSSVEDIPLRVLD